MYTTAENFTTFLGVVFEREYESEISERMSIEHFPSNEFESITASDENDEIIFDIDYLTNIRIIYSVENRDILDINFSLFHLESDSYDVEEIEKSLVKLEYFLNILESHNELGLLKEKILIAFYDLIDKNELCDEEEIKELTAEDYISVIKQIDDCKTLTLDCRKMN